MASVVAIVSLAISCAVFGWTLYRDITNKGRLRVGCFIGNIVTTVPGGKNIVSDPQLVYIVTNIGRQPIMVIEIGGRKKGEREWEFMINAKSLPRMLKPSEYLTEYTDARLLEEEIKCLYARDSLGKVYKLKRRNLQRLMKSYKNKQYTEVQSG